MSLKVNYNRAATKNEQTYCLKVFTFYRFPCSIILHRPLNVIITLFSSKVPSSHNRRIHTFNTLRDVALLREL